MHAMNDASGAVEPAAGGLPTDPAGLPESGRPQLVELGDGEAFDLRIGAVAKPLNDVTVRMLAYNGSIPGPILRVRQGSEVLVNVVNDGDLPTTVHWHGLRLDNRYDGTHLTQEPIAWASGSATSSRSRNTARSSGSTATSWSSPSSATYWPAVNARSRSHRTMS